MNVRDVYFPDLLQTPGVKQSRRPYSERAESRSAVFVYYMKGFVPIVGTCELTYGEKGR